jgi:hypothetical protein
MTFSHLWQYLYDFLLRIKNIWNKICRENRNTFYFQLLFPENHVVYEIMSTHVVETGRKQYGACAWHTRYVRLHARKQTPAIVHPHRSTKIYRRTHAQACPYPRAHTHTLTQKYLTLTAFPRQQWLRKRASMLRYMYIDVFVMLRLVDAKEGVPAL